MCYFHIGDLLLEKGGVISREAYEAYFKEPGTLKARYMRYVKTNLGKKNALNKLMKLITDTEFMDLRRADETIDWNQASIVRL